MSRKIKRKKPMNNSQAPKFYIIRWEFKGNEVHRCLLDNEHFVFWAAGETREQSLKEIERQESWFKKYPDTWGDTLKLFLDVQKKNIANQKTLLAKLLEKPHVVILPSIEFFLEPVDDAEFEKMLPKQRKFVEQHYEKLKEEEKSQQRKKVEQQEEQQREEKTKQLKGLLKRKFRK